MQRVQREQQAGPQSVSVSLTTQPQRLGAAGSMKRMAVAQGTSTCGSKTAAKKDRQIDK